jgi:tetratricopeptide (TPR) repeat protein
MSNPVFDNEWITLANKDPYAALGISLVADDNRISKRYRLIARKLHPDVLDPAHTIMGEILTRIINPTHAQLKVENKREEIRATLRVRVRQIVSKGDFNPSFESAQQLLRIPDDEVDVFYENTVARLAERQFESVENFHLALQQLAQMNLTFLRRKIMVTSVREKRSGLLTVAANSAIRDGSASNSGAASKPAEIPTINYAERYGIRAKTYLKQQNYELALNELREALKIEPNNTDYHSMIGQTYFVLQKYGMARVHLKKVLASNPNHKIAQKYIALVDQKQPNSSKGTANSANRMHSDPEAATATATQSQTTVAQATRQPRVATAASTMAPPKTNWIGRLFRRG